MSATNITAYDKFMNLYYSDNSALITQELCDEALREDSSISLQCIPKQFRTKEICKDHLADSPLYYWLIPDEHMDKEMWVSVFERDGELIRNGDIPNEMLTQEMYEIAVIRGGLKLEYVPQPFRNKAMCIHAVNYQEYSGVDIFTFIPTHIINDKSLHCKFVSANPSLLSQLEEEDKTVDVCRAAIRRDYSMALPYLPENIENIIPLIVEIIETADNLDSVFGHLLPDRYKTRNICMMAVAKDGMLLKYIPLKMMDREICTTACKNTPDAEKFIPNCLNTILRL